MAFCESVVAVVFCCFRGWCVSSIWSFVHSSFESLGFRLIIVREKPPRAGGDVHADKQTIREQGIPSFHTATPTQTCVYLLQSFAFTISITDSGDGEMAIKFWEKRKKISFTDAFLCLQMFFTLLDSDIAITMMVIFFLLQLKPWNRK